MPLSTERFVKILFLISISYQAQLKVSGKCVMEAEKTSGNFDLLNLEYDYSRDFTFFSPI